MLYKKSFDLNKEESQIKNSEKLYQPKKFRWCKYIVVPLLIGFILLLILTNVDFNGDAYDKTWLATEENNLTKASKVINDLSLVKSFLTRDDLECINSSNFCTLTCKNGTVNNMYKLLEPLYKYCGSDMVLILNNCNFPAGTLKSDFFEGNFRLRELNITDCNLNAIEDKAFLQDSVKGLKKLYMIDTQFVSLEPSAFEGLEELECFEMQNHASSWTTFKGYAFLKHFSQTLTKLFIQQETTKNVAYDPYNWLNGSDMLTLQIVNLNDNNFQNLLNNQTFSTLVAVTELYLSNCSINYLPFNVFDDVVQTLDYLDLSDNHLTTLPAEMLFNMNGLNLYINFNYWDCTCENKEMLLIIQNNIANINYWEREYLNCYTPQDVKDIRIDELTLECLTETTVPIYDTTSSDLNTTVTSSSTESGISTTYSESEATDTTELETIETSGETNEYETTRTTTTERYSTSTSTPTSTTIVQPTPFPYYKIVCAYATVNTIPYVHNLRQEKCTFAIYFLTKTSVLVVLSQFLNNIEVFYFTNSTQSTNSTQRITPSPRQQYKYSIEITDLDSKSMYVFCLIQNKQSKLSPFDCKSFVMPEDLPHPWLLNGDQTWILCLVVLGICLMLLLGIVVMIIVERFKKRRNIKCLNENSATQMPTNCHNGLSSIPLRNLSTAQRSSTELYRSQHQPPDVISPHVNYNIDNDSYMYEDLTM